MRLSNKERALLSIDILMLLLAIFNLAWIFFDALFSSHWIQDFLQEYWQVFYDFYMPIHQNFAYYDLWFVGIFLSELIIRWILAIIGRSYSKWWFYPFIHWYDVLGCIPVGSLRILRVFRIVSVLLRLQRSQVVDLTRSYFFKQFSKYYKVLVEEVSDRVVLNVLDGVKKEIDEGNPVLDRIIREVIEPRKELLATYISDRIQVVLNEHYQDRRNEIREYVDHRIEEAVKQNKELGTLSAIPVLGNQVKNTIEAAIADIVFHVLNGLAEDLGSDQNRLLVDEIAQIILDSLLFHSDPSALDGAIAEIGQQSLDIVSDQVRIKQWQVREDQERLARGKKAIYSDGSELDQSLDKQVVDQSDVSSEED